MSFRATAYSWRSSETTTIWKRVQGEEVGAEEEDGGKEVGAEEVGAEGALTFPSCWWTLRLYTMTSPSRISSRDLSAKACSGASSGRPSNRPSAPWLPSTGGGGGELVRKAPLATLTPSGAAYSLSTSVLCSTASVRIFTFSSWVRGRLGVIRLTAAVLRKRLARPRVGELSQLGRARAPPTAAAANGLWQKPKPQRC